MNKEQRDKISQAVKLLNQIDFADYSLTEWETKENGQIFVETNGFGSVKMALDFLEPLSNSKEIENLVQTKIYYNLHDNGDIYWSVGNEPIAEQEELKENVWGKIGTVLIVLFVLFLIASLIVGMYQLGSWVISLF